MRSTGAKRLIITGIAVALAALSVTTASNSAYGADRPAETPAVTTSYTVNGYLSAVVDVSRTEAFAAGNSGSSNNPTTLLLHWNGQKWAPVTAPKPVTGDLLGLTEVNSKSIFAVGFQVTSSKAIVPLILHWNGSSWSHLSGPAGVQGGFSGIGQAGSTLLAVGASNGDPMLNMERTGNTWKKLPVPSTAGDLLNVIVTGTKSAWAGGITENAKTFSPNGDVLLRWNGSSWKSVSFPLQGTNHELWGMAGGPHGAVWAVGASTNSSGSSSAPLSMLWNGSAWRKVAVPSPADGELDGVGFVPGGTAWAVGDSGFGANTLVLRWTGTAWQKVASPSPLYDVYLNAVSASSTSDAWAVGAGSATATSAWKTIIEHWNGDAWH